eukprot:756299-Hanusia_phi.AAC.4
MEKSKRHSESSSKEVLTHLYEDHDVVEHKRKSLTETRKRQTVIKIRLSSLRWDKHRKILEQVVRRELSQLFLTLTARALLNHEFNEVPAAQPQTLVQRDNRSFHWQESKQSTATQPYPTATCQTISTYRTRISPTTLVGPHTKDDAGSGHQHEEEDRFRQRADAASGVSRG